MLTQKPAFILGNPARPGIVANWFSFDDREAVPYLSYGFRMKTTLNIDDTVMAKLKRKAARQGRTCPNWSRLRCAYCSAPNESRAESPLCRRSAAAVRSSKLPTATPRTKPRKLLIARGRHECVDLRRRCRFTPRFHDGSSAGACQALTRSGHCAGHA
jgi:hypothetical protein